MHDRRNQGDHLSSVNLLETLENIHCDYERKIYILVPLESYEIYNIEKVNYFERQT